MKKAILLLVICGLVSCIGSSKIPVIYVSPNTTDVYTTLTFSPVVEFPDGIPDQSDVTIRINGIDVTDEFDRWDNAGDNKAAITGQVDNGSYPTMLASFREGTNTFQVTQPSKSLMYFNMNLGGADVHITEVVDGYCGTVFLDSVGDVLDISDGSVTDFDCSGFHRRKCVHASFFTGNDNLGNPQYSSPYVAECEFAQGTGPAVPLYFDTRQANKSMYIRGYFESTSPMTSMTISGFDVSSNATPPAGVWSLDNTTGAVPHNSTDWVSGSHYVNFGTSGVNCNGETVDLDVNEFCGVVPDPHGIRIVSTDSNGSGATEWLRSDVEQSDQRLGNGGVFALRGEVTALEEILDIVSKQLSNNEDLIPGSTELVVMDRADSPPGFCIGCKEFHVALTNLFLNEFKMKSDFPTPGTSNGRGGTWPPGQLNIDIDLDSQSGWGVDIDGYIDIKCNTIIFGLPNPICAVIEAAAEGPLLAQLDLSTVAEVVISLDSSYKMRTSTVLSDFDIVNQNIQIDSSLGGLVDFIIDIVVGMIEGEIGNMVGGMVEGLVNAIFNKDIPLSRLVIPSVNTQGEHTKVFMSLSPSMSEFTTNVNVYDDEVAGELAFGLHATGKPRINKSIGSLFDSAAPQGLYQVTTARDDDPNLFVDANAGFMLHESFVNQLMMGLWESGILYIDFNAGNDPLVNTFIDNANIKFASASPWTIAHLADITLGDGTKENAKGDVRLNIDDLVIHFSGDIYDPFNQVWEFDQVFFELVIELEVYADLAANDGAFGIVFDSSPVMSMLNFYSDYVEIDPSLGNSLMQQAAIFLETNIGGFDIDLPAVLGLSLDFGDIWIPDSSNLAFTVNAYYEGPTFREYINRWSGNCLTPTGGLANGTNINVQACADRDDQKWGLDPLTGFFHNFANDDYCAIHSPADPTNQTLQVWDCSISRPMVFNSNKLRSSVLATQFVEQNTGNTNAEFRAETENDQQLWDLGKEGLVYTPLVENLAGFCLDGWPSAGGSNVFVWTCNGTPQEEWAFERSTGLIHLIDTVNPNLCLDHSGDNTSVFLSTCDIAAIFNWRGGVFSSIDNPTQVLTATGYANGANVTMSPRISGAMNQIWSTEVKTLSFIEFVNDETGECMTVDGGAAFDGANVTNSECSSVAIGSPAAFNLATASFGLVGGATCCSYGSFASLYNGSDDTGGGSFHAARNGASGDWGISVNLGGDNTITNVAVNGRNDCCDNRMNGVVARLYDGGSLVYSSGALGGANTGISDIAIPAVVADEIRLVFPGTNGGGNDGWMNFSELYVTVNNGLPSGIAQSWAIHPFNGNIVSELDQSFCLANTTGVPANGRNLELTNCDPTEYSFRYAFENIISREDDDFKVDIAGGSGSSVNLWTGDGSRSQIWTKGRRAIEYDEIISRKNGRCLGVAGGTVANDQNIKLNGGGCSGGDTESWGLNYYTGQLHNKADPTYCATYGGGTPGAGVNMVLYKCHLRPNDKFAFNDDFNLVAAGSGFTMQTQTNDSDNVKLEANAATVAKQWKIGRYVWGDLQSKRDGYCVDASGGGASNGQNLIIWTCHGGTNQKYAYDTVTEQWHNKEDPNLCIGSSSTTMSTGVNIILTKCSDGHSWTYDSDGFISNNFNNGYNLDASGASEGSTIHNWTYHGGDNQIWAWVSE